MQWDFLFCFFKYKKFVEILLNLICKRVVNFDVFVWTFLKWKGTIQFKSYLNIYSGYDSTTPLAEYSRVNHWNMQSKKNSDVYSKNSQHN